MIYDNEKYERERRILNAEIEEFENGNSVHDFMLLDADTRDFIGAIHANKITLERFVKMYYGEMRRFSKYTMRKLPKRIIAHMTYTNKEYIFNMEA